MWEPAMRRACQHIPGLRNPFPDGLPAYAILVELASTVVGFDLSFRRSDLMPFRRLAIAQLGAIFPEYEVCCAILDILQMEVCTLTWSPAPRRATIRPG
jgi:hypothetical protein